MRSGRTGWRLAASEAVRRWLAFHRADQPHPADGRQPEHHGVPPLARAKQRPRAAESLPRPDQLDHEPCAWGDEHGGERAAHRDRRAEQRPHGKAHASPQGAERDGDKQQARADVRDQPPQRGEQIAGAEPAAANRGLTRRAGSVDKQQAGHEREPGNRREVRRGECQRGQCPGGQHRVPLRPGQAASDGHAPIVCHARPSGASRQCPN